MPRALRIQYPGAIYHLMNHCDRREPSFKHDAGLKLFPKTLGQACAKTSWQIHASHFMFLE